MIVAKTVSPNQFWILRKDDKKIGNIQSGPDGYHVMINNTVHKYKTIHTIKKQISINFVPFQFEKPKKPTKSVNGYPTDTLAYNSMYDVKNRLPLYTKTKKSKSWYAAGWYMVKYGSRWREEFCPKLLTLRRQQFVGPVKSREDLVLK